MKEKINRSNYEAYFLDFAEGNLSKEDGLLLQLFLKKHPDLKEELEEFELTHLPAPSKTDFLSTARLKREETTGLPLADYLMISEVEKTITEEEKAQLARLVKEDDVLIAKLGVYHKTILSPAKEIIFPAKDQLTKKETKVLFWWNYAAAAAAVLLGVLLFPWENADQKYIPSKMEYSWQESSAVPIESYAFVVQEKQPTANPSKKEASPVAKPVQQMNLNNNQEMAAQAAEQPMNKKSEVVQEVEDLVVEAMEKNPIIIPDEPQINPVVLEPPSKAVLAKVNEKKFIPVREFAEQRILKGKTLSETLVDELAELAKKKIDLEVKRSKSEDKFAINIGSFKFSRNR